MSELVRAFERAGLKCEVVNRPMVGTQVDIFQMDIGRATKGNTRAEWFRIWQGAESNRVQVTGADREICQLVLMVHEQAREFDQPLLHWEVTKFQKEHGENWKEEFAKRFGVRADKIFKQNGAWFVKNKTSGAKRHFLCGLDERQLFIAQLTKPVSTVKEAHASLKSPTVTFAEGRAQGRTIRQGEWFFVNCTQAELNEIKRLIGGKVGVILKRQPIEERRGGKPHIADELFRMSGKVLEHGFSVRRRPEIFVRGAIRHPDHKTVSFKTWRKVIRNTEGATSGGGASGINWID